MIIKEFENAGQKLTIQETIVRYILNFEKAPSALIGGSRVGTNCIESFVDMKERFGYSDDVQLKHFVITFGPNHTTSLQKITEFTSTLATFVGYTNQVLYAVHENTTPVHVHFIINPICHLNGKLWGQTELETEQFITFATGLYIYNYCI